MTTGDKIAKLRKEHNYTQEQLAELLGVSRQSISKYESGLAYPETAKLIKLSELFDCTVDYLLKDNVEESKPCEPQITADESLGVILIKKLALLSSYEKKSKRTICGLPLWHIGKNAKGIIAVGLKAKGIVSVGLLSLGVFSFGMLSLGLLSFGILAVGLLSIGCFALGALAIGAICAGIIAIGAIAIGEFSIGALAVGHYFAYGDYASAMFALGDTNASGTVFESVQDISATEKQAVIKEMYQKIPEAYNFIISWISKFF